MSHINTFYLFFVCKIAKDLTGFVLCGKYIIMDNEMGPDEFLLLRGQKKSKVAEVSQKYLVEEFAPPPQKSSSKGNSVRIHTAVSSVR